jgi:osmotically-inducible protein OsmY
MTPNRRLRTTACGLTVALVLCWAVLSCGSPAGRTTTEVFRDWALANNVRNHLRDNPRLQPFAIEVSAADGVVTLSGSVDSDRTRTEAEQTARSVTGVIDVVNQLSVP